MTRKSVSRFVTTGEGKGFLTITMMMMMINLNDQTNEKLHLMDGVIAKAAMATCSSS